MSGNGDQLAPDAKPTNTPDAKGGMDATDAKPTSAGSAKSTDVQDAKPMSGGPFRPAMPSSGQRVPIITSEEFLADTYKMNYPRRGKAIIISNKSFDRKLGLGERTGTEQDLISLHQRFSEMGFDVDPHENLSIKGMKSVLADAAASESYNLEADCFICAILTHGEEGVVYGIDAKAEVKELIEPFKGRNCKSLIGKPKIFFIQACQGGQFDGGVAVNAVDAKGEMPMDVDVQVHKIPSEADFLIAYSVVPGFFSWRNSANGSWFVQALSEILAKHWKDMDLLTMMTRVNKKVAYEFESRTGKDFMNQKKQIPCVTSMLTKEVKFTQKD